MNLTPLILPIQFHTTLMTYREMMPQIQGLIGQKNWRRKSVADWVQTSLDMKKIMLLIVKCIVWN